MVHRIAGPESGVLKVDTRSPLILEYRKEENKEGRN